VFERCSINVAIIWSTSNYWWNNSKETSELLDAAWKARTMEKTDAKFCIKKLSIFYENTKEICENLKDTKKIILIPGVSILIFTKNSQTLKQCSPEKIVIKTSFQISIWFSIYQVIDSIPSIFFQAAFFQFKRISSLYFSNFENRLLIIIL
jgi:hypothetical protein